MCSGMVVCQVGGVKRKFHWGVLEKWLLVMSTGPGFIPSIHMAAYNQLYVAPVSRVPETSYGFSEQ